MKRIKDSGSVSYLKVVSTTPESCLNSARVAVEIGVDRLLGGTDAEEILKVIAGSGVSYYPFPSVPAGHPTKLGGSLELIAEHRRYFETMSCAWVDLLAHRVTDADPLALTRAAMKG